MRKTAIRIAGLALIAAAACCACSSSPRAGGSEGNEAALRFAEMEDDPHAGILLELEAERDGARQFRLMYPDLGQVAIKGSAEPEGEGWRLKFERLDWFNNWSDGWTEASFLLEGESALEPVPSDVVSGDSASEAWTLSLRSMPRLDAVRSAAIRYFETYLRGDKGAEEFSRRWGRIRAVGASLLESPGGSGLARRPDAIGRLLFPEVYGYDEPPAPGYRKVFGRGREWNSDYSIEHFPEGLRKIRDDGTMFRDYVESPGLWRLALSWDDFWEHRGYAAGLRRLPPSK
jgi:hypothetical protein